VFSASVALAGGAHRPSHTPPPIELYTIGPTGSYRGEMRAVKQRGSVFVPSPMNCFTWAMLVKARLMAVGDVIGLA